jgi:hypothetical protein
MYRFTADETEALVVTFPVPGGATSVTQAEFTALVSTTLLSRLHSLSHAC